MKKIDDFSFLTEELIRNYHMHSIFITFDTENSYIGEIHTRTNFFKERKIIPIRY